MNPEELESQLRQQVEHGSQGGADVLGSLGDGLGDIADAAVDVVSDGHSTESSRGLANCSAELSAQYSIRNLTAPAQSKRR